MKISLSGLFLLSCLLSGCGSSADNVAAISSTGPQTNLAVNPPTVHALGPDSQGELTVEDLQETVLGRSDFHGGSGSVDVATLPSRPLLMRLELPSSDGFGAGDGPATFLARLDTPQDNAVLKLDIPTTMIARLRQVHPTLSEQQAADKIAAAWNLSSEDGAGVSGFERFNPALFYAHAAEVNGINLLLDQWVADLSGRNGAQRSYASPVPEPSGDYSPSGIAKGLFKGALSYVGGKAFGWLVSSIGIADGGPDVGALLTEVLERLDNLSRQIREQDLTQQYRTLEASLEDTRVKVEQYTRELRNLASPDNHDLPSDKQIQDLLDEIRAIRTRQALIARTEVPLDFNTAGLTMLYLNSMERYVSKEWPERTLQPFYVKEQYPRFTEHFQKQSNLQELLVNLLVEETHQDNPPRLAETEEYVDAFFVALKQQRNLYPLPVTDPDNVLLDTRTGLLWSRRTYTVGNYNDMQGFVSNLSLGGSRAWKVPSLDELYGLMTSIDKYQIDQHQDIYLTRAGFLPSGQQQTIGDRPELGKWRYSVWTNYHYDTRVGYNLITRARRMDLVNARWTENDVVFVTVSSGRMVADPVAFLVNRPVPTVTSLTISEKSRDGFKVQYKATARLSDGTDMDLTEQAIWALDVGHLTARVSNAQESSGEVTLRTSPSAPIKVTASYRGYKTGQVVSNQLTLSGVTYTNAPEAIVVHPSRRRVPASTTRVDLAAKKVMNNGVVFGEVQSDLTWTSSDPSVTVSGGHVTIAHPTTTRKTVTITATLPGGTIAGLSHLILEP